MGGTYGGRKIDGTHVFTGERSVMGYRINKLASSLGDPANPLQTPEVIKPEWFFYVAFRWLKLFSGTAAVLSMGFIVMTFFGWPFIDAWIRKHTKFKEASVWVGIAGVLIIIGMTVWEGLARH